MVYVLATLALILTSVTPGLAALRLLRRASPQHRRLSLSPTELLLAGVALSLTLTYVAALALFAAGRHDLYWLLPLLGALLAIPAWAALRTLRSRSASRGMLARTGLLLAYLLSLVLLANYFTGGKWAADWLEHTQRARYFAGRLPDDFRYIGLYLLPARPPMQNVLTAITLPAEPDPATLPPRPPAVTNPNVPPLSPQSRQMADDAPRIIGPPIGLHLHQLACLAFAALSALPVFALARLFWASTLPPRGPPMIRQTASPRDAASEDADDLRAPHRRSRPPSFLPAFLLACSAAFVAHTLFPWTRSLTAFFVLTGLYFYLRGFSRRSPGRLVLAFLALGAGMATHYSTAPFLLALAAHLVVTCALRRSAPFPRWPAVAACAAASFLPLLPWLAFSVSRFGLEGTLATNTAVSDTARLTPAENATKIAHNLYATLVPPQLRPADHAMFDKFFAQTSRLGTFRDWAFHTFVTTLVPSLGPWAGAAALVLLSRRLARPPTTRHHTPGRGFWIFFLSFTVVVGVAVHGELDVFGLAHICLLPLSMLALAFVSGLTPALPTRVRLLILAGALPELLLVIVPHVYLLATTAPAGIPLDTTWPLGRIPLANAYMLEVLGVAPISALVAAAKPLFALTATATAGYLFARAARESRSRP